MGSSKALQKYKRLHHEEGYPILGASIQNSEATIVLGGEDSEIPIKDQSQDFIEAATNIQRTVRRGEPMLIDVTATPAGDSETFLENLSKFTPHSESPVDTATGRINAGEANISEDVDIRSALNASLSEDLDNESLQEVVANYFEALAICRSNLNKHKFLIDDYQKNKTYNVEEFLSNFTLARSIILKSFNNKSPITAFEDVRNHRTDGEFLIQRLLSFTKTNHLEWDSMRENPPEVDQSDTKIRLSDMERKDGNHSEKVAELPGEIAINRILNEYAVHYELSQEPLHDLAVALNIPSDYNLDSHGEILDFLSDEESQQFTEPIAQQLRHGPSHVSTEIDTENQLVRIYNNRRKERAVKQTFTFQEVVNYRYGISDLLAALIHGLLMAEKEIEFTYLQSADFKYRIAERS